MQDDPPVLALRAITKRFGAVRALTDVGMELHAGEVLGLVGDNGAGKSTLAKVVSGAIQPDEGDIVFEGDPVHFRGPSNATDAGITVIYQDLALCDNLDVVANLFLGSERAPMSSAGFLDEAGMEARTLELLGELNVGAIRDVRATVEKLSGGQRQTIAIARALLGQPKVLLLDEPTAALGVIQSQQVLRVVRRLAERGLGVLIISHNIADVFEVCDRICVLRLGRVVANVSVPETTPDKVIAAITGSSSLTSGQMAKGGS